MWHILRIYTGYVPKTDDNGKAEATTVSIMEHVLNANGAEAYHPRYTLKRRNRRAGQARGKVIEVTKALFPGYLFARNRINLDRINANRLKARYMSHNGKPLTITDAQMDAVRASEIEASRSPTTWQPKPGDVVSLLRGQLTGTIKSIKRRKVVVQVNGRDIEAERGQLVLAGAK